MLSPYFVFLFFLDFQSFPTCFSLDVYPLLGYDESQSTFTYKSAYQPFSTAFAGFSHDNFKEMQVHNMIRFLRIFSVIIFLAALLVYGGIRYYTQSQSDKFGPVISMDEREITISVSDPVETMLTGITAFDELDGDVSDSLVIERMGLFSKKGQRQITVAAFDSHGNVTKSTRTVIYDDYISPRLFLIAPLRAAVSAVDVLADYVFAEDCIDGNITDSVQITQDGQTDTILMPGEYRVKITASNSVGDVVQIPVTAELYDYNTENLRPGILLTDYLIYVPVGSKIDPESYLKGVHIRNKDYIWGVSEQVPIEKSAVEIDNPVDTRTPGTYEIVYSVEDKDGNHGNVRLIVIVSED